MGEKSIWFFSIFLFLSCTDYEETRMRSKIFLLLQCSSYDEDSEDEDGEVGGI